MLTTTMGRNQCLFLSLIFGISGQADPGSEGCCERILVDFTGSDPTLGVGGLVADILGFYTQFGRRGARPAYRSVGAIGEDWESPGVIFRQLGGDFFIQFDEERNTWVSSENYRATLSDIRVENNQTNYCLESTGNIGGWFLHNGTQKIRLEELKVSCQSVEDVCCRNIEISSSSPELEWETQQALGEYTAIGMVGGRLAYQKKNEDRYLEYHSQHWNVFNPTSRITEYFHHSGGSLCPELIGGPGPRELTTSGSSSDILRDLDLTVTCRTEVNTNTTTTTTTSSTTAPQHRGYFYVYQYLTVAFGVLTLLLSILFIFILGRSTPNYFPRFVT